MYAESIEAFKLEEICGFNLDWFFLHGSKTYMTIQFSQFSLRVRGFRNHFFFILSSDSIDIEKDGFMALVVKGPLICQKKKFLQNEIKVCISDEN